LKKLLRVKDVWNQIIHIDGRFIVFCKRPGTRNPCERVLIDVSKIQPGGIIESVYNVVFINVVGISL